MLANTLIPYGVAENYEKATEIPPAKTLILSLLKPVVVSGTAEIDSR